MINFKSLVLDNDPLFGSVSFQFTRGLHVIRGLNRTTLSSTNGNAAGKSYLMSHVREIPQGQPLLGERTDRTVDGQQSLNIVLDKKKYTLSRERGKLKIYDEQGRPVGRSVKETKQWFERYFPLTESDIDTYVYNDSRIPHPFVMGNSTQRKNFLTEFFQLDKIDQERKIIKAQLDSLRDARTQKVEIERELLSLKGQIKTDSGGLKVEIQKLEVKLQKLQREQAKALEARRILDFIESSKDRIKALRFMKDKYGPLKRKYLLKEQVDRKAELKQNKKLLQDAHDYEAWAQQSKEYEEATANLPKKIKKLLSKPNLRKGLKNAHEQYVEHFADLKTLRRHLKETSSEKPKKPEQSDPGSLDDIRLELRDLQHSLDHAQRFGTGKCPTCGSKVKVGDPRKIGREINQKEKHLKLAKQWESYRTEVKAYKESSTRKGELEDQEREIQSKLDVLQEDHDLWIKIEDLPMPPKPFEGKRIESSVMDAMVQQDRDIIAAVDWALSNYEILKNALSFTREQQKLAKLDVHKSINQIQERLSTLRADLAVHQDRSSRRKALKLRLQELETKLEDEDALKLLLRAYDDKAMKKLAIQAISSHLMTQVNKYTGKIFPEDYKFELDWTKSQLNIVCHRYYQNIGRPSDVRKLSGAEFRLFTYIVILSLLAFVPQSRRSNLLILDEPATNMSKPTFESFKELLKIMQKVIPCIVIVTPATPSDEYYEGATEWTAVKYKGKSSLVKADPSQVQKMTPEQVRSLSQ